MEMNYTYGNRLILETLGYKPKPDYKNNMAMVWRLPNVDRAVDIFKVEGKLVTNDPAGEFHINMNTLLTAIPYLFTTYSPPRTNYLITTHYYITDTEVRLETTSPIVGSKYYFKSIYRINDPSEAHKGLYHCVIEYLEWKKKLDRSLDDSKTWKRMRIIDDIIDEYGTFDVSIDANVLKTFDGEYPEATNFDGELWFKDGDGDWLDVVTMKRTNAFDRVYFLIKEHYTNG